MDALQPAGPPAPAAAAGDLGEVRQLGADLGLVVDKPPTDRLLDPALGGGALLDMGVYPLTFAHLFLGEPSEVTAVPSREAGADLNLALSQVRRRRGRLADDQMTAWSPRTASIATDPGRIDLPAPFHHPRTVTWTACDHRPGFGGRPSRRSTRGLIGTGLRTRRSRWSAACATGRPRARWCRSRTP